MSCHESKMQEPTSASVHATKNATVPLAVEFVTPFCATAVGLFILNNAYLKWAYPSVFTGKLSDFLAAFFLPLLLSGLLHVLGMKRHRLRLMVGVTLTAFVFISVKTHEGASNLLDMALNTVAAPMRLTLVSNTVDPTDLIALLMLPVAYGYAVHQLKKYGECL